MVLKRTALVSVPTGPGAELDVPGGEWDALGSAGLNMTFTSQPCFKACPQEDACRPSLSPNFPVFCATRASQLCTQVLRWELGQDRESSGRRQTQAGRAAAVSPHAQVRRAGFGELGHPCCRMAQSHHNAAHLPVSAAQ